MQVFGGRSPSMRRLMALFAGLLVMAACGSPGARGGGGEKDSNGSLRIATDIEGGLYTYFDPVRYSSWPLMFTNLLYDTLLYYGPDGLEPGLATEWSFPDQSTVEFTLRQGVKFQDGSPLNAEAVKFSWDRVIAAGPEMTKVAAVKALESIEVVDDLTVRVRLSKPIAGDWRDRLLFSSQAGVGIVSPTAVRAAEAAGKKFDEAPVGAGPYKFVQFVPGQRVVLERWEGYWNPAAQQVARMEFVHTVPGAPTLTALAGGVADIASVTAADLNGLQAQGLVVDQYPPVFETTWYQFCVARAPFDNLAVRQAALHAIDRNAYTQAAYQGAATINDKFPAPKFPYYPDSIDNPYPFDPGQARQLLQRAGATGAAVTLLTGSDPLSAAVAQIMQQQLNAVGFTTQIRQSQNTFNDLPGVNWSIYFGAGSYPATSSAFFMPGGVGNACGYDNPELTTAFDRTRNPQATAADLDQAWADYQRVVYADAAQFSIANPNDLVGRSEKVQGVSGDITSGNPWVFADIYVTD